MKSLDDSTPIRPTFKKGINDRNESKEPGQNGEATSPSLKPSSSPSTTSSPSTSTSTLPFILQIWAPTLLLIFGGCCSNVYTLESIIHASPSSGSLITAFQFLLVSLFTLPRHFSPRRGLRNLYLRERNIPIRKWVVYTAYFLSINILNNMAFKYRIGIPLHIILRSAGPVTTMLAGIVWKGRRYPTQKIVAVLLLFGGVVLAAFADTWSKQVDIGAAVEELDDYRSAATEHLEPASTTSGVSAFSSQAPGFALLASALVLSACMGMYADDMYATHGRSAEITAETLFYSHTMSLPYFISQSRPLFFDFLSLLAVPGHDINYLSKTNAPTSSSSWLVTSSSVLPRPLMLLLLNAATQLLCIIGVNRLSAQSSSLTVSIVLNVRKLVSLVLSIWLFGNRLPMGVVMGAVIVFVGGGLYALPGPKGEKKGGKMPKEKEKTR
ncbi:uncharacterized protein Z519_07101 [Cladophialophora bantiana CBS 173.52]|uniref:Sugar phosphate transporter domain-containing protein n=1 Tax=Cladophialophora bantiana (strain ATCC 10958 / CBS 173.52 / CDC B-1940 / NIH 8579) TaxID=1442370 RepID=A0A0D2G065_CLAB1|nr:uncharacterized protein Z519_07101 [Cladophialophora bantiana CBS 173.52]KIW92117.1 hypothetical protein Z519_07101 [Cladophialophora bantiana CBS 173.52]